MFPFWYTKSCRGLARQGLLWVMSRVWVHPLFCRRFCSGRYWTIEPASDLELALFLEFFSCICVRNLRTGFEVLQTSYDIYWYVMNLLLTLCFPIFQALIIPLIHLLRSLGPKAPRRWFMAMSPPWRIAATQKPGLWQSGARRSSAWWWEMVQTNRLRGHRSMTTWEDSVQCLYVFLLQGKVRVWM